MVSIFCRTNGERLKCNAWKRQEHCGSQMNATIRDLKNNPASSTKFSVGVGCHPHRMTPRAFSSNPPVRV